jgi:hypothetical protein
MVGTGRMKDTRKLILLWEKTTTTVIESEVRQLHFQREQILLTKVVVMIRYNCILSDNSIDVGDKTISVVTAPTMGKKFTSRKKKLEPSLML